ncbi:MAG: glycerophosphodiester phosphodiesterase family protein, partial [Promethearchaeia archaeon]
WGDINLYVSHYLNYNINLVLFFFIILIIPLLYSVYLIFWFIFSTVKKQEITISRVNKIVPIFLFVIFAILGALLLFILDSYTAHLFIMFQFYSIFVYPPLILGPLVVYTILLKKYKSKFRKILKENILRFPFRKAAITVFFSLFLLAWSYPLLFIPANVIDYPLPEKPDIVAHRGGAVLGPENTIEAVETALDYDIVGWEVDIAISHDGVPFLMHDDSLKRTTNVEEIFPERSEDRADSFTWSELQQLNAGSWFAKSDPYGTISSGKVKPEQVKDYKDAKIPSFEQVLNFTRENNLILDFDTRGAPEGHPYHGYFTEILFNMTIDLMDNLEHIMIPTYSDSWLSLIDSNNVTEIWTYRDYDNTGDGYTDEEYREFYRDGFPIMVYTIDSAERFSQLWCLGVTWVKTNTPHKFYNMEFPLWSMQKRVYYSFWIGIYAIAVSLILLNIRTKQAYRDESKV